MEYAYLKALHIVFIVTWFAALFYMVRLFIYTTDAQGKDDVARPILTAQLLLMQKRLWYIIGWPGMAGTFVFGIWMLILNMGLLSLPWMWLKLISIVLLSLYHFECHRIFRQQSAGIYKHTSLKLRMFNELATVFLVAIVFLVVVKSTNGLLWGILGLIAFAAVLMLSVFLYRKSKARENQENDNENDAEENNQPAPPQS